MLRLGIVLAAVLLPYAIRLALFAANSKNRVATRRYTDENFIITIPEIVMILGILCAIVALVLLFVFTLTSDTPPHWLCYFLLGSFLCFGMHLIVRTLTFKVIVKGQQITVHSAFRKTFSFTFDEIISARRQVKKNEVNSERIVVQTECGKKLIVENREIAYTRFLKRIENEVPNKYLSGF